MTAERAAITGWAWRTPLGDRVDDVIKRLLAGERAARVDARFPTGTYPCRLGAPVTTTPRRSRHERFLRTMGLLALEVGAEAFAASGVAAGERLGVFAAVGGLRASWDELMPALERQELDGARSWDRGFARLHPFWMLQYLSNNAHGLLAAELSALGEGAVFAGATSGAMAMAAAARALAVGAIDAAVVVAYDSLLEPEAVVEASARGAVTRAEAGALVAPYSASPSGWVPAEAAAAIVLERPRDAGARSLALVRTADAADGAPGEPNERTLARVLRVIDVATVGAIDGAARAQRDLDDAERRVLRDALGADVPLIALASAMGETGAAKPVVQAIALAAILASEALPPIAGLRDAAPGPLRPLTRVEPTTSRSAIGLCSGAPGLAAATLVELP